MAISKQRVISRTGNCVYANGGRAVNPSMNERRATTPRMADGGVPLLRRVRWPLARARSLRPFSHVCLRMYANRIRIPEPTKSSPSPPPKPKEAMLPPQTANGNAGQDDDNDDDEEY